MAVVSQKALSDAGLKYANYFGYCDLVLSSGAPINWAKFEHGAISSVHEG